VKLRIDAELCTGHGRCYALASELFEPDDEGHGAVLHGGDVPPGQEDAAHRAANNCPERAISTLLSAPTRDENGES
jgi:ferredoxin